MFQPSRRRRLEGLVNTVPVTCLIFAGRTAHTARVNICILSTEPRTAPPTKWFSARNESVAVCALHVG